MLPLTNIRQCADAIFHVEPLRRRQPGALGHFECRVQQLDEDGLSCLRGQNRV